MFGCGSSTPTDNIPEPFNRAPSLSISQSGNYFEGDIVRTDFNASDIDGDTITFSLSGPDADLFVIDIEQSAIFAITDFDFELPSDENGDNTYLFDLIANDGTVSSKISISIPINNIIENEEFYLRRNVLINDKMTYKAFYTGLESYPTSMSGPGSISIEYLPYNSTELNIEDIEGDIFIRRTTFIYDDQTHILNDVVNQKNDNSLHLLGLIQSESQTYCTNYQYKCVGYLLEPSAYASADTYNTNFLHNLITQSDIVRDIYSTEGTFSMEVMSQVIFEDDNGIRYDAFELNFSRVFDEPPQAGHIESMIGKLYVHPAIGLLGGDIRLLTHLDVGSRSADIEFKLTNRSF